LTIAKLADEIPAAVNEATVPGGKPSLWGNLYTITANLTNSGELSGATVPQLYLTVPGPSGTPPKQLRGFEKVFLEAGASSTVSFALMRRDLSYWDVVSQDWVVPSGEFGVSVGFSSRDIHLTGSLTAL
jgi:beta-glucosidase